MDDQDKTVPQKGQTEEETKVPPTPDGGETEKKGEAHLQSVPGKLEGKSQEELLKIYGELERKVGEQGNELGNLRQFQRDAAVVLQAIRQNPELEGNVEKELLKIQGIEPDKSSLKKGNGEIRDVQADTRKSMEGQIMREFEDARGLSSLDSEKKNQVYAAVGRELHDMLNPGGSKTIPEILDSIELTKLAPMLDKAYYLAARDEVVAQAGREGALKARQNQAAAIGSISSSGEVSGSESLNEEERDVARKLGISDEDYRKSKKKEELKI